ncbi:putative disease resistance protein RGA4 [Eucalyptus grandis]|uniref:putative disease resistance protein RGA4 n=1 Tax=Eucalyptus grandis TaxID=71139 RepID=UPI00192E9648|nr:putative disease resistance protein RGA4 [Eucalyptus grandis]
MKMACGKREEIQDPEMLAIAEEIARKCSGVPLVVRTVGSLLFFKKTKFEWLHFKDYELPDVSQREDHIKYALRLSYDHLPSHLKQCFAFCSLFPKSYEMRKQTLVNLWMAEGFIQPPNRIQHLEDIAHGYFMDLLWSNFFQDFKKDPYTNEETCKMHDLMHDLACLVAGNECWVAWDDTKSIHERTRHISVGDLPISRLKVRSLRTFLSAMPRQRSEGDLCQLMQSFKRLHILDLHDTYVKKVPTSICKLKYLTYLDLSRNRALKRLPNSITRLQNLQTLNLYGCHYLEELPRGIKKLVSLRNLDIGACWELSYVPRGLGQLSSLHRLTRFILPREKALTKNYCGLGELNGLNNIRGSLCIENLGSAVNVVEESRAANLIGKHSLESLELHWSYLRADDVMIGDRDEALLDGLQPHTNLQKLKITNYTCEIFPRWMMDNLMFSLPNLVELCLEHCRRCKHLPPLGQLRHLKTLKINHLTELECIKSDHSFTLTASFPSLLTLSIEYCEKLEVLPRTPNLEDLVLIESNLALINHMLGLNKLKRLGIWSMEFLECLPENCLKSLTSLESLHISGCPWLTSLSLGMQHLLSLRHLSIGDCEKLDLSKDESGNFLDFHGLQSLQSVAIFNLPRLASIPQWLLQLGNLEHLKISECINLKAISEQIEALQSLRQLEIFDCPSLTSLPEGMRKLTSLTRLRIFRCPKLEERCKRDAGEDWYKIAHILNLTHELDDFD